MRLKLRLGDSDLQLEWPLVPRLLAYTPYLLSIGVWIPLAFELMPGSMSPIAAVGTAVLPPVLLLSAIAPKLAAEFSRRVITLRRAESGISIGQAGVFAPDQLSLTSTPGRRLWGARFTLVRLVARTNVGSVPVELELLHERFSAEKQAEDLVRELRSFLRC